MERGLIHVYYGDGKGKTTAAVGLAVRAMGAGLTVCFAQFMKSGKSSERRELRSLGIRVIGGAQEGFTCEMAEEQKAQARERNNAVLDEALLLTDDVLVLDEAMDACRLGLLDYDRVLDLVRNKPATMELVITGHEPDQAILEAADYVTEAVCRKHPFAEGVAARLGIEY